MSVLFDQADSVIGLFGAGADGHTAGLLPHCPLLDEQTRIFSHYDAPDFRRLTLCPPATSQLDHAYLYATGEPKWWVIDALRHEGSRYDVPVLILQDADHTTVLSDVKEV